MAADAMAPYVTRSSGVMILTKHDKQVFVFHKKGFQVPVSS